MREETPPRLRFRLGLAAPWLLLACAAPGLTPATGAFTAITVVCEFCPRRALDSLARTLEAPLPAVLPPEPSFRLDIVGATGSGVPRREKNVVVLARSVASGPCGRALAQALSPPEAARWRQSGGWFVLRDVWAEGQEVSLLGARSEAELEALLLDAGPRLLRQFEASTLARAATAALVDTAAGRGLRRHGFVLAVPAGYTLIDTMPSGPVQLLRPQPTRLVTVCWREAVEAGTWRQEETLFDLQRRCLLHGDSLLPATRGVVASLVAPERLVLHSVWQNHGAVAGGPLVTHFVYDPSRHRLYGVQGQLFAPGDSKRALLFELEALLLTFRLEEIS